MSVIRKKPFIEEVVDDLTLPQKKALIDVMNSAGNNVEASLLNMPAKGITPVLFKLDEANLKTGILIYTDNACVLIAYHRFQDVLLFELFPNSTSYKKINEYCDINELRRILTVGNEVTAGEINSGNAEENMVLAADGDGGAEWKDVMNTITPETVESGDAVQLFGFDAEGNLVKDDMPEGITVDQSVIEDSPNAVAGGAVYDELQNHYTKTEVDGLLETKANVDGNYPTMTVGVADQLSPYDEESGDDQDEPFSFQATGTGNGSQPDFATGAIALMKEKRGNTIVVNQQLQDPNFTSTSNWSNDANVTTSVANNILTATLTSTDGRIGQTLSNSLVVGHKYLGFVYVNPSKTSRIQFGTHSVVSGGITQVFEDKSDLPANTWTMLKGVITANNEDQYFKIVYVSGFSIGDTIDNKNVAVIDLTQMFGSNDNIPADLLSHPENFFRYYQGSLAYNEGELVNANGRYVKCIGRNQWDEEWELGYYYNIGTGEKEQSSYWSCSKNKQKCISNLDYYLYYSSISGNTVRVCWFDSNENYIGYEEIYNTNKVIHSPSNATYFAFSVSVNQAYNHDITISLYYEGESGYDQYYPYEVLTNNDTGNEVLRSAGNVFDSKSPDGTITRRVGYVDLSTLSWTASGSNMYAIANDLGIKNPSGPGVAGNGICSTMQIGSYFASTSNSGVIGWYSDGTNTYLNVMSNSSPTGTLFFELATPTTEQGTPFSENVAIDDFGSMSFEGTNGVPQGNLIFYPVDYKAFIDTLYDYTDGTPSNIALKSDLTGLVEQEILDNDVTDVAGLTYIIKKMIKTGRAFNLSARIKNGTGSTIAANTTLFTVPSGAYYTQLTTYFTVIKEDSSDNTTEEVLYIDGYTGNCKIKNALNNNDSLFISISYVI